MPNLKGMDEKDIEAKYPKEWLQLISKENSSRRDRREAYSAKEHLCVRIAKSWGTDKGMKQFGGLIKAANIYKEADTAWRAALIMPHATMGRRTATTRRCTGYWPGL